MGRSEASKQAQREYGKQYDKENRVNYAFKLNKLVDADIIEWLEKIPSRQAYIKDLIRKDMNK